MNIETREIAVGEFTFTTDLAGPADGPPALLLHGFPDFALTWRHVLDDLAAAGYYAVALDLRGAGCSSIPSEPEAYHLERHAADLTAVLAQLQSETTHEPTTPHVIAHDFGASVAWMAAMRTPLPLASLAVLNGVHPAHVRTTHDVGVTLPVVDAHVVAVDRDDREQSRVRHRDHDVADLEHRAQRSSNLKGNRNCQLCRF